LFDERANTALAYALDSLGHPCIVIGFGRKDKPELLSYADAVIEVGHARSDEIPKNCIHIAWVQEYYGNGRDPDYNGRALPQDRIYTFGDPRILGAPQFKHWIGSLCMGVDPELLNQPPVKPNLDFSIAGFIASPKFFKDPVTNPITAKLMDLIVAETRITPLSGSFDQAGEVARFKTILDGYFDPRSRASIDAVSAMNIHETARLQNRFALARLILSVSKNVEFWGLHWDLWPEFAAYAKPFTNDRKALLDLYQRSRINAHDNIFGFAMHSRVLEAMAVGGFVMAHGSPHVGAAGQMTETFIPGVHYGEYNADNFVEEAGWWLKHPYERQRASVEARKVIADKHLWKHRAQQILNDLA